jgi:hypothetical protein
MRRSRVVSLFTTLLTVLSASLSLKAESTNDAPQFKEIYDLLRAHLAGMSEAELNRAAVQSLVSGLSPKVTLVTNEAGYTATTGPLVSKSSLFGGDILYLRVSRVEEGLDKAVREAYTKTGATNKLNGVVLDLRFCGGADYAAAAAVGDLFLKKERPLLNWGKGAVSSKAKEETLAYPAAVLVNHRTSGAAEALAAVLRETGTGLVLGAQTAGEAMIAQEFPLSNGQKLRIATAPIQLGDGSSLSAEGLKPDIKVEVAAQDEQSYYADAFAVLRPSLTLGGEGPPAASAGGGTNRPSRRGRFNEAELVRERRDGVSLDLEIPTGKESEQEKPLVHDPALARAIDVLKGLAVVRQSRS